MYPNKRKSWGSSMYNDILKKYDIPKSRLFFIIDEPDEKKVLSIVRQSKKGIRAIRKRHAMLIDYYKQQRELDSK